MIFYLDEWFVELICLLDILKKDFSDVDENIFQGVERPYEHISCIMSIEKTDLDEEACDFLNRRMALKLDKMPSERFKMN
jgi:hypothetical protein